MIDGEDILERGIVIVRGKGRRKKMTTQARSPRRQMGEKVGEDEREDLNGERKTKGRSVGSAILQYAVRHTPVVGLVLEATDRAKGLPDEEIQKKYGVGADVDDMKSLYNFLKRKK